MLIAVVDTSPEVSCPWEVGILASLDLPVQQGAEDDVFWRQRTFTFEPLFRRFGDFGTPY